ncbi:MarR family transcriptional regulator [Streptomyces sp. NBC_01102]|uniref:MarR family winged helix-turn-helix transcriptional regulator n=1 Tax=unclassified Streptomyces TaxID=2593676 RepID=UPI00386C5A33|nr:MarR family transcriptional regulator [Streptomyces sp. NBC_01102]
MPEHPKEPPPPGPAATDDVDAVTHAVLTASRLLVTIAVRSLAAVEDRVTLPQFRLLMVLSSHRDAKLVDLAERLGVNPSTAMRMVDRLIAAGLAERRVNPDNRRETELRVTPEGCRLVADVMADRRREIAAIVERLAPRQRAALVEALAAFTEAGGEQAAPDVDPFGWT